MSIFQAKLGSPPICWLELGCVMREASEVIFSVIFDGRKLLSEKNIRLIKAESEFGMNDENRDVRTRHLFERGI